jgi:hypothetical protein
MEQNETQNMILDSVLLENVVDETVEIDLAGYQVTKAEFFSHVTEPSVTIWNDRVKFNMACIRRFPGITHIQLLVNVIEKRLIIKPCHADAPDSLRWISGGTQAEIRNKEMRCRVFCAKLFDLMSWNPAFRYKLLGKPAVYKEEILFLFRLSDFELFVASSSTKRHAAYFPLDWRDVFGTPALEHEESYKIDLADGYVITNE